MKQIGIKQARQRLADLIDQVEAGEEILITRNDKPVAKLVPAHRELKRLPSLEDFRHAIESSRTPSAELLRAERDVR